MKYTHTILLPSGTSLHVAKVKGEAISNIKIEDLSLEDRLYLANAAFDKKLREYACIESIIEPIK